MRVIYRPDIPPHAAESVRHLPPDIKRGVKAAIRALSADPSAGEPLLRELEGFWKYRVNRFRLVYVVDRKFRVIKIVAVDHRRRIYERVAELIQPRR